MSRQIGRPKKLRKPKTLLTRRVRRLIDLAHDGNLQEASEATGLPYATLRDLYSGRTTNPRVNTLIRLAQSYGFSEPWFLQEDLGEVVPFAARTCYLPADAFWAGPEDNNVLELAGHVREVQIPFVAWPLAEVYTVLRDYLQSYLPSENRPIVGDESNESFIDFDLRLSKFLLGPLVAAAQEAHERGALEVIPLGPPRTPEEQERMLKPLRALGRFWELAIPDLLARAREYGRQPGTSPASRMKSVE
jgi:transcriptional regulator with XRE-family HTH domain